MAKKERIVIHRDDDLKSIDDELDAAIGRLDGANDRIGTLLQRLEKNEALDIPETIVADWHDETAAARSVRGGEEKEEE
ncbi:MAG: hypothetical protein FJY92_05915 [Candidatus Hydrogenedentes bacterium]|nr:hypothetical protein [Candidatus Hydrogenedentota bacterium]